MARRKDPGSDTRRRRAGGLDAMERLFRAFGDGTRLRILGLLLNGEACVCHLQESLGVPQPTVSRHLAYLRRAGLVAARRDGQWMHYRLAPVGDDVVRTIVGTVAHCLGHLATIARDRERLVRLVGCCAPPAVSPPTLACCAARSVAASVGAPAEESVPS